MEDMKAEAVDRGRLPTLTEARALSVDDPQLSNVWIAVQNPLLQEGRIDATITPKSVVSTWKFVR